MTEIDFCVENMYDGLRERVIDRLDGKKFLREEDLRNAIICELHVDDKFGLWVDEMIPSLLNRNFNTIEDIIYEYGICGIIERGKLEGFEMNGRNLATLALKIKFLDYIGTTIEFAENIADDYWEDGAGRFCA